MFSVPPRALACVLFLSTAIVRGDVIFSNYGPGYTYGISGWHTIDMRVANSFTVGATPYYLSSIGVAVSRMYQDSEVDIALMSDDEGLPGTVIEAILDSSVTTALVYDPDTNTATGSLLLTSIIRPLLQANTRYWIAVSTDPPGADSAVLWMVNSIGQTGPRAIWRIPEGSTPGDAFVGPWEEWGTFGGPAFEIQGDAVPEPATGLLAALSLGALTLFPARVRKRTN